MRHAIFTGPDSANAWLVDISHSRARLAGQVRTTDGDV